MDIYAMLTSDPRYQLLAVYSAQHLRAVAGRVIARAELPPLNFSTLLWRSMWQSPIPPLLHPESDNEFLQENGCPYPRPYGLESWITTNNKGILDFQSANKIIYLASFIEKDWGLSRQMPIWRKHATNRINGYAYNIVQMFMYDGLSDAYPTEYYVTFGYDLLSGELKNKRLNHWVSTYQKKSKDPFVVASMEITRISNMRSIFLWQVTLETVKGLCTSLTVEATPGDSYLSYVHPVRQKRVHPFIGYI
ncbi:hypothetical protein [Serratia marcescens]|uniref:hypothetical protein n=1 Tax=Serratia marcescens TaxID=615 RepID=UPI003B84CE4A